MNINIFFGFVFSALIIAGLAAPGLMWLWGALCIIACFASYAINRLR
ncbi:hypothetical protein LO749_12060 [Paracoccus denitrificans]|nr:hypothetical protein [Paracoccus denitrificans]UFS64868.1 hypothetical protein LO749_12060 [Paracoccus denitrificans]